jgi:hypothetical protein
MFRIKYTKYGKKWLAAPERKAYTKAICGLSGKTRKVQYAVRHNIVDRGEKS